MIFSEFGNIGSKNSFENIKIYDKDINRYIFLFRRVYKIALESGSRESFGLTLSNLLNQWEVSNHLEIIGTVLRETYEFSLKIKNQNALKVVLNTIKNIEEYYVDTMKSYYSKNISHAYDIAKLRKDVLIPKLDKIKGFKEDSNTTIVKSKIELLISLINKIIRRIYSWLKSLKNILVKE